VEGFADGDEVSGIEGAGESGRRVTLDNPAGQLANPGCSRVQLGNVLRNKPAGIWSRYRFIADLRSFERMKNVRFRTIASATLPFVFALLFCCLSSRLAVAADKGPLAVFLERNDVRENDSVRVHFQVTNDGSSNVSAAQITIISPANFMQWYCGGCKPENENLLSKVDLGPISISQTVDKEVWFHTLPNIPVGQFNLLFRLEMTVESKPQKYVVLAEKPVTVKLLGTDTLGGIPLALSGLILPGFCFWLVLSLLGVRWSVGLALGDKLVYSIAVSLVLLSICAWLSVADISSGLSIKKLFLWAGSGVLTGVAVGGPDWLWRWLKKKREKEITLEPLDDGQLVFRKLLVRYASKEKPLSKVVLKDNKEYYGSLVHRDPDKTTLVGWYQLEKSKAHGDTQNIKALSKEILNDSTVLEESEGILVLKDGVYTDTGHWLLQWNNADVLHAEIRKSGWKRKPLELT
jgi:hypothetical protein